MSDLSWPQEKNMEERAHGVLIREGYDIFRMKEKQIKLNISQIILYSHEHSYMYSKLMYLHRDTKEIFYFFFSCYKVEILVKVNEMSKSSSKL